MVGLADLELLNLRSKIERVNVQFSLCAILEAIEIAKIVLIFAEKVDFFRLFS